MERIPHKLNAPGDFYVEDECCTACDIPSGEAPGFFKFEETDNDLYPDKKSYHCYFCKQPKNNEEVQWVINAMQVQEIDCIRYKGNKLEILKLMENEGMEEYSDILEPSIPKTELEPSLIEKFIKWLK